MFCPKCGAKNPDGAKFCGACGEPFRSAPAPAPAAAPASAAPGAAPTTFPQAAPTTGKTLPKKTIAIVAGAVVVVVAVVAVALTLFGGGKPFEGTIDLSGIQLIATDKSMTMRSGNELIFSGTIDETRRDDNCMVYELDNVESTASGWDSVDNAGMAVSVPDGAVRGDATGEWRFVMDAQQNGQRVLFIFWADVDDSGTIQYMQTTAYGSDQASVEMLDPFSEDFDPEAGGGTIRTASWNKDDGAYTLVNESGQQATLTITPSK